MLRPLITAIVLVASLTACDKFSGKGDKKDAAAVPVKLTIAPVGGWRIVLSVLRKAATGAAFRLSLTGR